MNKLNDIGVCILAGGQARRMMGKDKPLMKIAGKPMLGYVIEILSHQTEGPIIINANGDLNRFVDYDYPVVPDIVPGSAGPLAGILTGLNWMLEQKTVPEFMLSVPADAPLIPKDLIPKLISEAENSNAEIVSVMSNGRTHPVIALWKTNLLAPLKHAILEEDIRKIDKWTATRNIAHVTWETDPYDPFYNVNHPEDLTFAEELLKEL